MQLMDEMGLTDSMNATEWAADRQKAQKSRIRKLNAKRDAARAEKRLKNKKKRRLSPALLKKAKSRKPKRARRADDAPGGGDVVCPGGPSADGPGLPGGPSAGPAGPVVGPSHIADTRANRSTL